MTRDSVCMESEVERVFACADALKKCGNDKQRVDVLDKEPRVLQWVENSGWGQSFFSKMDLEGELIIKSLIAISQEHLLHSQQTSCVFSEALRTMIEDLVPVEAFYKEIGGIVGYHWTMISCLGAKKHQAGRFFHRPDGIDISVQNDEVITLILEGIVSLPLLAEMYPVGGAADRLKFIDPISFQPLPAAKLTFCGHSLLEGLIRDLQARESLYYKLFGEQITTPIAMMTSSEKDNHFHILELLEQNRWFGRTKDCYQIFCQRGVPTMDREGRWCLQDQSGKLLMKPGGHGVIWKVAKEAGVFDWLEAHGRKKILIRQINNPIAGVDHGLLSFCGAGFRDDKVFGFASCSRQIGSAEGVNILIEKRGFEMSNFCLSNIEYCDFPQFSIEDVPMEPGSPYSQFPSNTNILFADISAAKEAIKSCPIPGMLVNLKEMSFADEKGNIYQREVARLESTMQNLADCFSEEVDFSVSSKDVDLKTYLTYNHRRKTISTTKKLFQENVSLLETPEGCFYDHLCNARDLLVNHCHMSVPEIPDMDSYIHKGPSFLFSYHPALGPLFSIIGQKISGGFFNLYSELKLEIAEVHIESLKLSGSLHILAERVMGEVGEDGILRYSDRVGCVRLNNVSVENRGLDKAANNCYWKDEIERHELCEILIHGDGEFVAENVALRGNLRIDVETGSRLTAFEENGELKFKKEALSGIEKRWIYHLSDNGEILLHNHKRG